MDHILQESESGISKRTKVAIVLAIVVLLLLVIGYHMNSMPVNYFHIKPQDEEGVWEKSDAEGRKKFIVAKLYTIFNDTFAQFPESKIIDELIKTISYREIVDGFQMLDEVIKQEIANQKTNPNANSNVDKLMQCLVA